MLGLVGLVLAFGLSLAVGRYEARRAAVVDDANAIGTTYLRAQTLREPLRTQSLERWRATPTRAFGCRTPCLEAASPGRSSPTASSCSVSSGDSPDRRSPAQPCASAPRLYVETLNEMIDQQTVRVAALNNRVPGAVLAVELGGAAIALGLLAFYLSLLGRGMVTVVLAAGLVTVLLLVTFDLDRPTRGLIRVPDTPLVSLRASMALPPAATGPPSP